MSKMDRLSQEEFMKYFPPTPQNAEIKKLAKELISREHGDYLLRPNQSDRSLLLCTACGAWVNIVNKTPRHAGLLICPNCHTTGQVIDRWRVKNISGRCSWLGLINYYSKSPIDQKSVCCQAVEVTRLVNEDLTITNKLQTKAWYLFRPGHVPQEFEERYGWVWSADDYQGGRQIKLIEEHKTINDVGRQNYNVSAYSYRYATDWLSFKLAIRNTYLQYCAAERLNLNYTTNHQDSLLLIQYLDMYQKKPWLEMVAKLGLGALIEHKLICGSTYDFRSQSIINWRSNKGQNAIKILTKSDIKYLAKHNTLDYDDLILLCQARNSTGLPIEDIYKIIISKDVAKYEKCTFLKYFERYGITTEKIKHYLPRMGLTDIGITGATNMYLDWIDQAVRAGLNMKDKSNLWPLNLRVRQANLEAQTEIARKKNLQKTLDTTLKVRNKIYTYEGHDFIVRPIQSIKEIILEGRLLHHCVGNYAGRYAAGETDILVLRRKNEPEKPYVTIEIHQINRTREQRKKFELRQCYTDHDHLPPTEVKSFVDDYVKKLNERTVAK